MILSASVLEMPGNLSRSRSLAEFKSTGALGCPCHPSRAPWAAARASLARGPAGGRGKAQRNLA